MVNTRLSRPVLYLYSRKVKALQPAQLSQISPHPFSSAQTPRLHHHNLTVWNGGFGSLQNEDVQPINGF